MTNHNNIENVDVQFFVYTQKKKKKQSKKFEMYGHKTVHKTINSNNYR